MRKAITGGIADQALWSLANFILVFTLARGAGVIGFGELSLLIAIMMAAVSAARGYFGISLLMDDRGDRSEASSALSAAIQGSALCAVALALLAWLFGQTSWSIVLCSLPFMVGHEVLRCFAISCGHTYLAVRSSVLRVLVSTIAYLITFSTVSKLVPLVLLVWAVSNAISFVQLYRGLEVRLKWRGLGPWWRSGWKLRAANGFDLLAAAATSVVYVAVLTVTLGPAELAGLRGAAAIMGPFNMFVSALPAVLLPWMVRSSKSVSRALAISSALLALLALFVGSGGLWLPSGLGSLVIGDVWASARFILPIVGLEFAFQAVRAVYINQLRIYNTGRSIVVLRLMTSVLTVLVAAIVPAFGDAVLVAWWMVAASCAATVALLVVLVVARAQHRSEGRGSTGGWDGA